MAIIYTYPTALPEINDILLGTEKDPTLRQPTKNFKIGDIAKFVLDTINGTSLQVPLFFDVTDPLTGLTQTTLVDSIIKQDINPNGTKITIQGAFEVNNEIYDSTGVAGTADQLLSSTVTGTKWIDAPPTAGTTFIYTQGAVALVWTIQHNLNKYPSVMAVDIQNLQYFGAVEYIDLNNLTITWGTPFKGFAYLN